MSAQRPKVFLDTAREQYAVMKNRRMSNQNPNKIRDSFIEQLCPFSNYDNLLAYYQFNEASGDLINIATTANGYPDGLGNIADSSSNSATQDQTPAIFDKSYLYDSANDTTPIGDTNGIFLFMTDTSLKFTFNM